MSTATVVPRRAWGRVIGLSLVLGICFGLTLNSLGLLTLPIRAAFRGSHEEAASIATAFLISMTIAMPLAGWLVDRLPARPVMVAGAVLAGGGYLLASRAGSLPVFIVALAATGAGIGFCTYVPAATLVTRWIPAQRQGLAFGILLAAVSVGGMIFPLALNQAIEVLGWRPAIAFAGVAILSVCAPLLFFLAQSPTNGSSSASARQEVQGGGASVGEALRSGQFWLWTLMLLLFTLSSLSILMALVPYLVAMGYSSTQAAMANTGVGAATLAGNFIFGALSNRWGAERTLVVGALASAAGILCLLAAGDAALGVAAVVAFALLWGTTFNLANQLSPTLLLDALGSAHFGSLLGIGNLLAGVVSAFGPQGVGHLVDVTHAYTWPLAGCAVLMVAAVPPLIALHHTRPAESSV
ncbi:MAG: MFS transporter [Proteobacteria bacterium]|nr:MFS transporter [Pseudomonadota bacterium]HQR04647.1 MFS transporter [Rhodocyclaceae bacterium]